MKRWCVFWMCVTLLLGNVACTSEEESSGATGGASATQGAEPAGDPLGGDEFSPSSEGEGEDEGTSSSELSEKDLEYRKGVEKFLQFWQKGQTQKMLAYLTSSAKQAFWKRRVPRLLRYSVFAVRLDRSVPRVGTVLETQNLQGNLSKYTFFFLLKREGGMWKIYGFQWKELVRSWEQYSPLKAEQLAQEVVLHLWDKANVFWLKTGKFPTIRDLRKDKLLKYPIRENGQYESYTYSLEKTQNGLRVYALPILSIPYEKGFLVDELRRLRYSEDGSPPHPMSPEVIPPRKSSKR